MQAKRATPGDDVLTRLAARVDGGLITDQDAADLSALLLLAGHETTANVIALSTVTLLHRPDQIPRLTPPDELADVVRESATVCPAAAIRLVES
ncbi:hypothetical protein AB5J52_42445 [Streptomyces sp. R39]|uniref:Cytochrome P450 n=1 Tax=Streptomyces sp. R39 TaxID=3238631 RepID=A0AB39R1J8_9ACTN